MGVSTQDLCPFCGTRDVVFTAVFEWTSLNGARALFICGHCREAVVHEIIGTKISLTANSGSALAQNVFLGERWPKAMSSDAPTDCPTNVARFFEQAIDSLNSGNFDAAGIMFRKSLESATKVLSVDNANKPLMRRIDALVEGGALTKDMGTWAHEIRLGGNDAAHDDDPFTGEEARALHDFSENFLRYSFTLPAAVARRASPAD